MEEVEDGNSDLRINAILSKKTNVHKHTYFGTCISSQSSLRCKGCFQSFIPVFSILVNGAIILSSEPKTLVILYSLTLHILSINKSVRSTFRLYSESDHFLPLPLITSTPSYSQYLLFQLLPPRWNQNLWRWGSGISMFKAPREIPMCSQGWSTFHPTGRLFTGRYNHHFAKGKQESWTGYVTCPRKYSWEKPEIRCHSSLLGASTASFHVLSTQLFIRLA